MQGTKRKRKVRCYHYNEEGHVKDNCPKLKSKAKEKNKKAAQNKYKTLKATWDETSSELEIEAIPGLALVASHQEDEGEASLSQMSIESIDEGETTLEESSTLEGASDYGIDKCLSRALQNENPKLLMAASTLLLPFQPLMVSALHTGLMEVAFAKQALSRPDLKMAHNLHKMSSLLGGAFFVADDCFPEIPYLHAAWHLAAAVGVSTCNKLLE
ncbi:uncharacterized protein LOC121991660 isoform X2 [Zingiber officinale]|uniref:uncharacterized protein LOC121991660 isoform X2 n=1 Tax=Zingiber officinale TaxID=94328 RepID=UPI001C4CAD81|nr:uncharacterized protein LOC121991660 isoform X2 [Zingiber officinale]XP_042401585.1 uncharacterized protein LOC121991660 isoform X2 [Zingiber officinale]XP_042401586.1 uncharacterized protein LOC121991660 isoform X2 [Zingiber officinale]